MLDDELIIAGCLMLTVALLCCAFMLAGIKDILSCIEYDLGQRNLQSLIRMQKDTQPEDFTIE